MFSTRRRRHISIRRHIIFSTRRRFFTTRRNLFSTRRRRYLRTSRISGVFITILSGKFYEIVCLVLKFFSLFCISPESSRVRRRPRNNTSFRRSSKSITRYILLRKTERVLRVIYTKGIYVFRTKCFKFDDIFTST